MRLIFWRLSKWTFISLIILAIFGLAVAIFVPQFRHKSDGCYWTSAMLPYVDCPDVPYGRYFEFVLNLPFNVVFYFWLLKGLIPIIVLIVLLLGACYPIGWLIGKAKANWKATRNDNGQA